MTTTFAKPSDRTPPAFHHHQQQQHAAVAYHPPPFTPPAASPQVTTTPPLSRRPQVSPTNKSSRRSNKSSKKQQLDMSTILNLILSAAWLKPCLLGLSAGMTIALLLQSVLLQTNHDNLYPQHTFPNASTAMNMKTVERMVDLTILPPPASQPCEEQQQSANAIAHLESQLDQTKERLRHALHEINSTHNQFRHAKAIQAERERHSNELQQQLDQAQRDLERANGQMGELRRFAARAGADAMLLDGLQQRHSDPSLPPGGESPPSSDATFSQNNATTAKPDDDQRRLGAIVFLAPRRLELSMWNGIDRFCLLLRAVRSVDLNLNQHFGPYPIFILVAEDYQLDDREFDGPYSDADLALFKKWAPHTPELQFIKVPLYSGDALSPGLTPEKLAEYRSVQPSERLPPVRLGYASMCRLWSGRLQTMSWLHDHFQYYMRMDDDSLMTAQPRTDPFKTMKREGLQYVYRRSAHDKNGAKQLSIIAQPLLPDPAAAAQSTFWRGGRNGQLTGSSPYNNFHIASVDFWSSPAWTRMFAAIDEHHLYYRRHLGDATVHALALAFLQPNEQARWGTFPYAHNSNDLHKAWGPVSWKHECNAAYQEAGINVQFKPRDRRRRRRLLRR